MTWYCQSKVKLYVTESFKQFKHYNYYPPPHGPKIKTRLGKSKHVLCY